jgi:Na+-transporting methylmalonyl-CoA/oxaloacetate decarboxylase gamma subunit
LLALVWAVMAILVVAIAGPANLSRKYHKQEEPPEDATDSGQLVEPVPTRDQGGLGTSGT